MYETGGMRRVYLRGRENILKRLVINAVGFNLALVMRKTFGVGKPRRLQGLAEPFFELCAKIWRLRRRFGGLQAAMAARTADYGSFFGADTFTMRLRPTSAYA